uniref:hypothetical protein n=1 Tax=Neorhizobium sp. EC2-8 TaxID=3129230 RepID=UPI003100D10F
MRTRAADDVNYLLTQRREADGEDARRARTIFQRQADALGLFVELYDNALRDHERRPIGNVEAHAVGRLSQTRAMVQDKRASGEFPAAHRLPADLAVETSEGTRKRLTHYFGVALDREAIDRDVFSPTDRLSRLANVADSWMEAAGMRKILSRAANSVAAGTMSANAAMSEIIEPGYAAAIDEARRKIGRNIALAERNAIASVVIDETGAPLRAMRDDLRLRTKDIANRARAQAMMEAVFAETARHGRLGQQQRRAADAFVEGIAANERTLGLGRDGAAVRSTLLVPARHLPDLSAGEIDARLRNSVRLADKRAEIDNLSRLVFGNSQAVSSSVLNIRDARSGAAAGDDVREGRLGEMAGEGRTWLKQPSPARQSAEAHAPRLAAALADYGVAVDFERHQINLHHREEQARHRVEVPRPSKELTALMSRTGEEQVRRLNSDPALRRELEKITLAMTKRLSSADRADLKGEMSQS